MTSEAQPQGPVLNNPGVSGAAVSTVKSNFKGTNAPNGTGGMMEFLRANGPQANHTVDPQKLSTDEAVKQPQPVSTPTKVIPQPINRASSPVQPLPEPKLSIPGTTTPPVDDNPFNPETVEDPAPEIEAPKKAEETIPQETLEEDIPEDAPIQEINFKKLRTKYKETAKTLKELQEKNTVTEKKLSDYESGTVVPEVLQQTEAKIQELERYKHIVDFKASPEYDEKFVKPLNALGTQLDSYAKDYDIPTDVLKDALSYKNQAELNRFLDAHFDGVGALEVKQIITKMRSLQDESRQFEQEPLKAIDRLRTENARVFEQKEYERKSNIAQSSKSAWVDSLTQIRVENIVQELIPRENDTKHNDTFVKPILSHAAGEYGKFIRSLAEMGIKELPSREAKVIARAFLLSTASGFAIKTRDDAVTHLNNLERTVERTTRYTRPNIGSSNPTSASSGQPQFSHQTPEQAALDLVNRVVTSRKK